MTTGPYRVIEVEDAGTAPCSCDNCTWQGPANKTVEVKDCALSPGDPSPVGRCPECSGMTYLDAPIRGISVNQQLLSLANELDEYLREIRAENLDGSEPELGKLLEKSLTIRQALTK